MSDRYLILYVVAVAVLTVISFFASYGYRGKRMTRIFYSIIVAGIIGYLAATYLYRPLQRKPVEPDILQQINKLNGIQSSLSELQDFISKQKKILVETERNIRLMKEEKRKLEPLVRADKETLASLLESLQARVQAQIWKDRFGAFLVGFISSLAANLLPQWFKKRWKKRLPN
jgi:uncharacterized membrane protein YraQ (UPF0718 family)